MNDPLGIRVLSSGTIATLMRQSCRFLLYQCSDGWWIDKVQLHFLWFSRTGTWPQWQDCWDAYLRLLERWADSRYCSYMGETDVLWQGQRVRAGKFIRSDVAALERTGRDRRPPGHTRSRLLQAQSRR